MTILLKNLTTTFSELVLIEEAMELAEPLTNEES